jgi:hypothetical protein
VQQSDVLITGANGAVGVTFIDSSRLSAGPNSRVELKQFRFDPTTHDGEFVTDVQRGTLAVVSGQIAKRSPDAMKVKTQRPFWACAVLPSRSKLKSKSLRPARRWIVRQLRNILWASAACAFFAGCATVKPASKVNTYVVLLPEERRRTDGRDCRRRC